MTGDEFRKVCDFEVGLKIGDPVLVRWTNCGRYFRAAGTVAKINAKSLRVTLTESVLWGDEYTYPVGREILVPSIDNIRDWSCSNRVEPVGGYK